MAVKKEVGVEVIEKAKKRLAGLPEKLPPVKLVDEALDELKPLIVEAIKKNYSKQEIVDELNNAGFNIKMYSLNQLLKQKKEE